jgi:hypothetical protein
MRRPVTAYATSWRANPVVVAGEPPIAVRTLDSIVALEGNTHRRAALARAADTSARDTIGAARGVVDGMRAIGTALGLDAPRSLHAALGLGDAGDVVRASEAVLAATDELFREVDHWVRPRVDLVRGAHLSWEDRMRTLAVTRATELIPLGDRPGIASRWIARIGLGDLLGRIRDDSKRPAVAAVGLRAFCEHAGERSIISGTGTISALGAAALTGVITESLALVLPQEERPAPRLGVDRVHHAVASTLGRRLFLEPAFLQREATVDRGAQEPVVLEMLHAELFNLRLDAALALFGVDVLARNADLAARLRQYIERAVGSAPAPIWAAHYGARWLDGRAGARVLASITETRLRDQLRVSNDEDWYRNPRAGEALRDAMNALREQGALTWGITEKADSFDAAPLARRLAETLRNAQR